MGRIVVSENVSLDGVVQDPTGEEGFRHGGWFGQFGGKDIEAWGKVALEEALRAEALLLGRRTYESFAARWSSRDGALADRLNHMPKFVVSSTLESAEWNNSKLRSGDVPAEVSKLRQELGGEILIYGSIRLARALLGHGLIDELRLTVYPVVLGAGEHLFGEAGDKKPLRLLDTRTVGAGLAHLVYESG